MNCINCGSELSTNANFCINCGQNVEIDNSKKVGPDSTLNSEERAKTLQLRKQTVFIGDNHSYYFEKWKQENSWNWASFFLSSLWLGYRKMYSTIFIMCGIYAALDIIMYIINPYASEKAGIYLGFIIMFYMGARGNSLYKRHMQKKIFEIENTGLDERAKLHEIEMTGGKSGLGVFYSFLIFFGYGIFNAILYWGYY